MVTINFYSKRHCTACDVVRARLQMLKINYNEIFDHGQSSPQIEYCGRWLRSPITTSKLKQFLKENGILKQ